MATDRGLPSVPRGLERGLTQYLQSLDALVRRLSGTVRGSGESRAVRASEAHSAFGGSGGGGSSPSIDLGTIAAQVLRDSSVTERKLADNAVTERKLGENSVTAKAIAPGEVINNALAEGAVAASKLATGAVTASAIAHGAVTASAIADGCISAVKLGKGVIPEIPKIPEIPVLPVYAHGEANNGDTVTIPGTWDVQPLVMLTWFESVAVETSEEIDKNGEIVTISLHTNRAGAVNMHEKENKSGVWTFTAAGRFSWVAVCQS